MSTTAPPPRLVLLHQQDLLRRAVVDFLHQKGAANLLAHVADAPALKRSLTLHTPDLLLICLESATAADRALLTWCQQHKPQLPIVVLGTTTDHRTVLYLLAKGVHAYCCANRQLDLLPRILQLAHSGARWFPPEVWAHLQTQLPTHSAEYAAHLALPLEDRYAKVLRLLLHKPALTQAQMADRMNLSVACVRKYLNAVARRYQVRGTSALVQLALDLGLKG